MGSSCKHIDVQIDKDICELRNGVQYAWYISVASLLVMTPVLFHELIPMVRNSPSYGFKGVEFSFSTLLK